MMCRVISVSFLRNKERERELYYYYFCHFKRVELKFEFFDGKFSVPTGEVETSFMCCWVSFGRSTTAFKISSFLFVSVIKLKPLRLATSLLFYLFISVFDWLCLVYALMGCFLLILKSMQTEMIVSFLQYLNVPLLFSKV